MNRKNLSSDWNKGCVCKRTESDLPVKGGLSVTPAEMFDMARRGIPVTTANLDMQFNDGEVNPSWDIPVDRQRGVDIGEIWQTSMDVKRKVKSAYKNDVKNYGQNLVKDS